MRHTKISMAHFSYHATVKKMIRNGELVGYEIVEDHNGISPALVLFFKSHKPMPIREYMWCEYFDLFEKYFKDKN